MDEGGELSDKLAPVVLFSYSKIEIFRS
jgi:hypothetical protein